MTILISVERPAGHLSTVQQVHHSVHLSVSSFLHHHDSNHTWLGSDNAMKGLPWTMSCIPISYRYFSPITVHWERRGQKHRWQGVIFQSRQIDLMCAGGSRETGILTPCVERRWDINLVLTLSQEPSQSLTVLWQQCVWSCQSATLECISPGSTPFYPQICSFALLWFN